MREKTLRILIPVITILVLFVMETTDGPWKDELLNKIGTSLYESSVLVSGVERENGWVRFAMGKRLYLEGDEPEEEIKKRLVYMENQGDGEGSDSPEEEGGTPIYSSGNASAVVSENLAGLPVMGGSGAGTAAYVNRLRESKDVKYLWNHFYIIDSTTSVTKSLFPVEDMLKRNMTVRPKEGKKQILIYHTHGASEAFSNSKRGRESDSIVGVGDVLTQELEKQGYGVYHDRSKYDWIDGKLDRSKAYNMSLEGVQKVLQENPDIQVTIDLHRDSVGKNKHTYTMIDGKKTAIVMFFNGMSRTKSGKIDYLYNPNLEANLSFSLQLKCHAMETFEGFTKPIYLKGYRYNLHLKERALLIELGNENNTVAEAKNAAAPLAKVIADVLKGEVNGF